MTSDQTVQNKINEHKHPGTMLLPQTIWFPVDYILLICMTSAVGF